jgi:hypothetical protein
MGLIKQLPCYIAGSRVGIDDSEDVLMVNSLDGKDSIQSIATSPSQLRKCLRFAETSQLRLNKTPLPERLEVAKLVMKNYKKYTEQVIWGLTRFRGLVAKDVQWMIDLNDIWGEQLESLVEIVFGNNNLLARDIKFGACVYGKLHYRSKGEAALICASTMDGTPAIASICHAIISGTHLILRPSWRDTVTHFMFETLLENNLGHYAQLVRWPSSAENSMALNKQLVHNVKQAIVFCSDETFKELVGGLEDDDGFVTKKIKKYGTGLPLIIVSENTDLDKAAENVLEGGRLGNGKFCLSHSPILVKKEIYEEFTKKIVARATQLKSGDPSDLNTEKGYFDDEEIAQLSRAVKNFGGTRAHGTIGQSMDVLILRDVPIHSSCLHQEFPGTLLALIPYESTEQAIEIAQRSLKINHREAWTAVNIFGDTQLFDELSNRIEAYNFLRGGITAKPRILFPHQGNFFSFDLVRRMAVES